METLDDLGLFWIDEQLVLVAGSPLSGRTAYAVQSCFVADLEGNGPAVYFSLLANSWSIRQLFFLQQAKRSGDKNSINNLRNMPAIPIYLEDFDRPPIEKLIERIFYYKKEKGARFFVIDALQSIDYSSLGFFNPDRETAFNSVLELLKTVAKALCVIIMVVSEISNHWVKKGFPTIRDILDVTEAEEHCDQIFFIQNPDGEDAGHSSRTLIRAKSYFNADGSGKGMRFFEMHFDPDTMTFSRKTYDAGSID